MCNPGSPEVSVAVPVHNAEAMVGQALTSLLHQTFSRFEIIAINDGSTDGTARVLEGYASEDPRVRVFHQANRGVARTLNTCLLRSRAPLVARLDADDLAQPSRLTDQIRFIREHSETAVVAGQMQIVDENLKVLEEYNQHLANQTEVVKVGITRGAMSFGHPSVLMNRDMIIELGGYRPQFETAEDYDLWLRVIEVHPIMMIPKIVTTYRAWHGNVSGRKSHVQRITAEFSWLSHRARMETGSDPADEIQLFDRSSIDRYEALGSEELSRIRALYSELEDTEQSKSGNTDPDPAS